VQQSPPDITIIESFLTIGWFGKQHTESSSCYGGTTQIGLSYQSHCCHCKPWQESHKNERSLCELLVLFSSCGTLLMGSRTDNLPLPRQTIFSPHNCTMTSFTKLILIHHQWRLSPSTKLSYITPQEPHHHQELFKRSPVGFLLKSTRNWPRSWVQD